MNAPLQKNLALKIALTIAAVACAGALAFNRTFYDEALSGAFFSLALASVVILHLRVRPRWRDAGATCGPGARVGESLCKTCQQLLIDGGHAACDFLETDAIKFEYHRVSYRYNARGPQSSGKKGDFADRLTDADFGQRKRLSFNSDFKTPRDDNKNCVGCRILYNQRFAAQQWADFGP